MSSSLDERSALLPALAAAKVDHGPLHALLASLLVTLVTILDNLPYGYALFPPALQEYSWSVGVWSVLGSAVLAQIVLSFRSDFQCALGCCMVENLPFLQSMASGVFEAFRAREPTSAAEALPTIVACFAIGSLATSAAFCALATFDLGRDVERFPRSVLLGAVGGMGSYILTTGLAVSADREWSWSINGVRPFLKRPQLDQCLLAVLLVVILAVLQFVVAQLGRGDSPLLVPLFFLSVTPLFLTVLTLRGISVAEAQAESWLFCPPSGGGFGPGWPLLWQDVGAVDWGLVLQQLPTIAALAFFSVLHVPINVPGLSIVTRTRANVNNELRAHALCNFLAGCGGMLQGYMVMSTSALYHRVGGSSRSGGLLVAVLTTAFLVIGHGALGFVPRCLAGALMVHLGLDLLGEALLKSWRDVSGMEYVVIVVIVASMSLWGFLQGIALGFVLALLLFVHASSGSAVSEVVNGEGIRSGRFRDLQQHKRLDALLVPTLRVVRIAPSAIFFGTSEAFFSEVSRHVGGTVRYILIDFTKLQGLDSSGVARIRELV